MMHITTADAIEFPLALPIDLFLPLFQFL